MVNLIDVILIEGILDLQSWGGGKQLEHLEQVISTIAMLTTDIGYET